MEYYFVNFYSMQITKQSSMQKLKNAELLINSEVLFSISEISIII